MIKFLKNHKTITVIVLILSFLPSWGNSSNISISVEQTPTKYMETAAPYSILVNVENEGGNFKGKLHLLFPRRNNEPIEYFRNISVPAHTSKRYLLYVPKVYGYFPEYIVTVTSHGKEKAKYKVTTSWNSHSNILMAVATPQQSGFGYVSDTFKALYGNVTINCTVALSYLSPYQMPSQWMGYGNLDILVITNYDSLHLSQQQEEALIKYVARGGILLLSSSLNPTEFKGTFIEKYIPLRIQGTIPIEDEKVFTSKTLLLTGIPLGNVESTVKGYPLLISKQIGEGTLFFLCADIQKKVFTEKYETKHIWKPIFQKQMQYSSKAKLPKICNGVIKTTQVSPPPIGIIMLLILGYIALAVPLNFFYFKKKRKLFYIFLTIPLLSILFSIIIFIIGFITKGNNNTLREINVIYTTSQNPYGKVEADFSIFSAEKYKYNITFTNPDFVGCYDYTFPADYIPSNEEEDYFSLINHRISMWDIKKYEAMGVVNLKDGIKLDLRKSNQDRVIGKIVNSSSYPLKKCIILSTEGVTPPFDLPVGEKNIDMEIIPARDSRTLQDILRRFYRSEISNPKTTGFMYAQGIASISKYTYTKLYKDKFMLVGWSDTDILKIKTNQKRMKKYRVNIFLIR